MEKNTIKYENNSEITTGYNSIKADYINRLKSDANELAILKTSLSTEIFNKNKYDRIEFIVHGLAGTAKSFGFPEIGHLGHKAASLIENLSCNATELLPVLDKIIFLCEHSDTNTHNTPSQTSRPPQKKNKVLIIDDDLELSSLIKLILEQKNMSVSICNTSTMAIEYLRNSVPDLILLDILMPEMNGHELLNQIKNDQQLQFIPVIMLSSKKNQSDITKAFDHGVIDYLIKPIKPEQILIKIESALEAIRRKILIIESNQELNQSLCMNFKSYGFQTLSAFSANQAQILATKNTPDLTILDWTMPNMQALHFLKYAREENDLKHIPILILTGENSEQENAIENHPFIKKPIIPHDIVKRAITLMD